MKSNKFVLPVLLLAASLPALAATRTVTLAVPGMTCPVCPITVKRALKTVSGVSKVDVSYAKKEAVVTYDDAKTSVTALTKATADAGYPSKLEGTTK
ncbi:mercury resistance system periplasmic binding protein MerP [Acidipila rosea]|uniref:Periplasmic mercury ion-binding protein n=1 Tax=Acidipila rosea TaxID=768535 RepID=A0A4R1LBY5_9BACT|nr:mercury resistance system periplasmic binding protein MerP [Acidipila rosea]TCK75892.1 mercuric ion binding protein [Acidipila rosea]